MAKVTFDGDNKLISVNTGITTLNVTVDLYSDWKEWALTGNNAKYAPAFSAIGGEPIGGGLFTGSYFFLLNGWKIRPYEGDHTLTIEGNLFGQDGAEILVPTIGDYTVAVQYRNSSQAQSTAGADVSAILSAITTLQTMLDEVQGKVDEVWAIKGLDVARPLEVTHTLRKAGASIQQTITQDENVKVTVTRE